MRVLNFGSLNRDFVYSVPHIVVPGETLSSTGRNIYCGGKGLNQSLALVRAGAQVCHAGCIGNDGEDLLAMLTQNGVDTRFLQPIEGPSGHTIIQVDRHGQNCILLFGGSNHALTSEIIDETLSHFSADDWLLVQNETNLVPEIILKAHKKGMRVIWNPSPMPPVLDGYPLEAVSYFIVNELEGAALTGKTSPEEILSEMHRRYPQAKTVLTLGSDGSMYDDGKHIYSTPCVKVQAKDTTAAGDTFLGYFFALLDEIGPQAALDTASAAAAIAVTLPGAANAIPDIQTVQAFMNNLT